MARLACISLPDLTLQVALRRFPTPVNVPVVLVKQDRPMSPVLALNTVARAAGLRVGMRYSEALAVVGGVRAAVVSESEVALAQEEVLTLLDRWSPQVESCSFEPGTFWVEIGGLAGLFGTEVQWGTSVRIALANLRFRAVILLGWTRAGTYLVAQHRRRSGALVTPEAEARAQASVPLEALPLSVRHRRLLRTLGIQTWGHLSQLSSREVAKRLGADFLKEVQGIRALDALPLQVEPRLPERTFRICFGYAVENPLILQPLLDPALEKGVADIGRQGQVLRVLKVGLRKEGEEFFEEVIRLGQPTLEVKVLQRLLGLRLESVDLRPGVVEASLSFDTVPAPRNSGELFDPPVVRDLARGDAALALIRAQLGNNAVVRAALAPSHLPEESYVWEPFDTLEALSGPARKPIHSWAIRRVPFDPDLPVSPPSGQRVSGPFTLHQVSGNREVDREYWLLRTRNGEVHWVSWDRFAQRSRWQGVVD